MLSAEYGVEDDKRKNGAEFGSFFHLKQAQKQKDRNIHVFNITYMFCMYVCCSVDYCLSK